MLQYTNLQLIHNQYRAQLFQTQYHFTLMKIFVINLDKDKERLKFMKEQALKYGFEFDRVEGVYTANLTETELKSSVDYFRYKLRLGRNPGQGEIGCCLSHLKIYSKMIKENISCACILEDDIIILDHFNEQLRLLSNWLKSNNPMVVRLNLPNEGITDTIAIRDHGMTSACSYCLNLTAAKALLKDNYPMHTVADDWPYWDKKGIIELYNSNPKVCWHNNAASGFNSTITGINGEIKESKHHRFFASIQRKIFKGIGKLYDKIFS